MVAVADDQTEGSLPFWFVGVRALLDNLNVFASLTRHEPPWDTQTE